MEESQIIEETVVNKAIWTNAIEIKSAPGEEDKIVIVVFDIINRQRLNLELPQVLPDGDFLLPEKITLFYTST